MEGTASRKALETAMPGARMYTQEPRMASKEGGEGEQQEVRSGRWEGGLCM